MIWAPMGPMGLGPIKINVFWAPMGPWALGPHRICVNTSGVSCAENEIV